MFSGVKNAILADDDVQADRDANRFTVRNERDTI